jgi:hypothetical protein
MSFASTSTEFAMIDTRTTSGAFVLPLTSDIPGRIINIKDAYGTFTNSSLTVYTQGGEAFEDGTNFRILNNSWEQLQVYTASTTRWYITGGTEQNITTANISVFSTLQTFNWPSLCNTAGFGYGSTFNPTALGKISLLDNVFTSSTAGLVSTFIEMGNLNAQPAIMSTGGAFRWLMGVEPDAASMGRGLQFKIKRWNSFGFSNSAIRYGANLSTLLDTVNINSLGNVGINSVNPQHRLDVSGAILSRGTIYLGEVTQNPAFTDPITRATQAYIQLARSTIQIGQSDYGAALNITNLNGYNGTNSLVGILQNPRYRLDVNGAAAFSNSSTAPGFAYGHVKLFPNALGGEAAIGFYSTVTEVNTFMWLVGRSGNFGTAGNLGICPISNGSVNTATTTVFTPQGAVGIGTVTPLYTLDVNGLGRSRIIISTLTTNPSFAANSYGQYFNMSNTGITGATLPSLAAADNGWFVVLRNNTPVTLNMAWSGTTTGLPASSNTIPASNSLTLAWNGSAYIYY